MVHYSSDEYEVRWYEISKTYKTPKDFNDMNKVYKLHEEIFKYADPLSEYVGDVCLVLVVGGVIQSYLVYGGQSGGGVKLEFLATRPEMRNRGFSSILLDCFTDIAEDVGYSKISLQCRFKNKAAQSFYEKHGFKEEIEKYENDYYEDGDGAVYYTKNIAKEKSKTDAI